MSEHPDPEALSAYHDGEAPQLASHVQDCGACRADLARLAVVSEAVAGVVEPVDPAVVDGMVERALARADGTGAGQTDGAPRAELPRSLPRQPAPRRWAAAASVAAVLLLAIGVGGFLATADHGGSTANRTAAPSPGSSEKQASSPSASATTTGDAPIDGGNLGEVVGGSQLASDVEPTLQGRDTSAATDNPVLGAPSEAGATQAPRAVGTRACELEARSIDPGIGPLVYVAKATHNGAPATVLGFSPPTSGSGPPGPGSPRPISLFLMAQDGCGLLATTTLP